MKLFGQKVVYGIPQNMKPIVGIPYVPDKIWVRFRNTAEVKVYARENGNIHQYYLVDTGEQWEAHPTGSNCTKHKQWNILRMFQW